MKLLVDDKFLRAGDRLYDVVDDTLKALAASMPHRLIALDQLQGKLQAAKAGYDEAMCGECPEVSHDASRV